MLKNIFLVDDDRDDRDIFIEALAEIDSDYECTTAENGEDALKQLTSFTPDYIFIDLNMPRMSGRECLIGIKSMQRLEQTPIIVYSTSSLQKEKDDLAKLGANVFMTKPASFGELCDLLKDVLTE